MATPYAPRREIHFGPQLLAVYLGGSDCPFCTQSEFKAAVQGLGAVLASQAAAAGRSFHFVAVAVQWDVQAGLKYLRDLGDFDEVSAGGNWLNTSAAQRLFVDGRGAVPSIVLYERLLSCDGESDTMTFGPERELARYRGAKQILEWVRTGASVDGLLSHVAGGAQPQAT